LSLFGKCLNRNIFDHQTNQMPLSVNYLQVLKDIRFWILFFFLVRMYGITFPPLEIGHNWRQADMLSIARNFYEHDANPLYPVVDVAGEKSGIVGCEPPVLNYLVYLVSVVFGYDHWYGRLIVLITASIGTFFFYKLVRKYFDERAAFCATITLLVSYWFACSRKTIPDPFAVSLCIIALYYGLSYLETGKAWQLLIFFLLALPGCLEKAFAGSVLTVLAIPMLRPEYPWMRKIWLAASSAAIVLAFYAWFFIWVPHVNAIGGFPGHFFMGQSFESGLREMADSWQLIFKRFMDVPLKYIGFTAFVVSLAVMIWTRSWYVLAVFFLPFASYLIMLVKTGSSITFDTYYVTTVVPAMAFLVGCGLARIPNVKIAYVILLAIGVENIADQIYSFRIRQPYLALEELEPILDKLSTRSDAIAINSGIHNPTAMYMAHRRGWSEFSETLSDTTFVERIRQQGCKLVVVGRELYGDFDLPYARVYESKYYKIYKLE
jgi:hypothetical protein